MSAKFAFAKSLKEVRFLFCQTSEKSAAVRYVEAFDIARFQPTTSLLSLVNRWSQQQRFAICTLRIVL